MKYTIEKVVFAPKLFHNVDQKRRVKAYQKGNGLFVHRVLMSKEYRISHISGLCLPKFYKTRKEAINDLMLLQVEDWTNYKEKRDLLLNLYKSVTRS